MDYNEFVDVVKKLLADKLPEEYWGAALEVQEYSKINETYHGLIVNMEGKAVSPIFNLDAFFREYENGRNLDAITDGMADILKTAPEVSLDIQNYIQYDKSRIFMKVFNAEKNGAILQNAPHEKVENLAITYHLLIGERDKAFATTMVTNPMMDLFGITKQELQQDAMENSPKLFPMSIERLDDLLYNMAMKDPQLWDLLQDGPGGQPLVPIYVVTNDASLNGAAAIFYPGVMDQISRQLGENFSILPSSVHETLVVPDSAGITSMEFRSMVQEVNETHVAEADWLAGDVYHYDANAHVFELAGRYEQRMQDIQDGKEQPLLREEKEDVGDRASLLDRLKDKKGELGTEKHSPALDVSKRQKEDPSL